MNGNDFAKGKENNVFLVGVFEKENPKFCFLKPFQCFVVLSGYMSLQKFYDGNLSLKWVPNQLMHASSQPSSGHSNNGEFTNIWKNTINIEMQDIIYIHLHQKDESSPTCLTFVNCEGVQSAPFQLPAGQHSIAFLSSLETGLAPLLRLDPPLWTGSTKGSFPWKLLIFHLSKPLES